MNRRKAGLDVRVVLNQTFPSGTVETNPTTYTTLTQAGVGVVWRNGPPGAASGAYTHEKTFILDGKQAWIMTMNLDHSAPLYNREYVVVDDDAAEVAEADQIFVADYAGTASASGSPLVVSPDPANSRSALVALIDAAQKTLDVEGEEFSDNDKNGVAAAVAAAAKRGVVTRVVLATGTPTSAQTTAIATVKARGRQGGGLGRQIRHEHRDGSVHPRQGDRRRLHRVGVRRRLPGLRELQRGIARLQPRAGRGLRRAGRARQGRGRNRRRLQRGDPAVTAASAASVVTGRPARRPPPPARRRPHLQRHPRPRRSRRRRVHLGTQRGTRYCVTRRITDWLQAPSPVLSLTATWTAT